MRFCFGDRSLEFKGRPLVMGILNVTPDSFSDGGQCTSASDAVAKAERLLADGADILDIGGESTRPGYTAVESGEELERVVPVVKALRDAFGDEPVISIDTTKPEVAGAALESGADIVNDVSALKTGGSEMCGVLRKYNAGCILMHSGELVPGDRNMDDVAFSLKRSLEYAVRESGLSSEHFMLDSGIGFGKSLELNLACCVEFDALRRLGRPVMIGASRKSFLGKVTSRNVTERDFATTAVSAIAAYLGADVLRVHNVAAAVDAVAVAVALRGTGGR